MELVNILEFCILGIELGLVCKDGFVMVEVVYIWGLDGLICFFVIKKKRLKNKIYVCYNNILSLNER